MMLVEYSRAADAVYVALDQRLRVTRTVELDGCRNVDYDRAGRVIGIEFLGVSDGVLVRGLPVAPEVAAQIAEALVKKIKGLRVDAVSATAR